MIVFDLRCVSHGHPFEAWFGSSADYTDQSGRGLIACPLCGDQQIEKAPMAPAVPAKGSQRVVTQQQAIAMASDARDIAKLKAVVERMAEAQKDALKDSQWVGRQFADTARAMHYGEQDHSKIHGEVAPQEARALIEEGVPVAPLPLPVLPPKARN